MIEKMYERNLDEMGSEIKSLELPEILRSCRELMGLKQYACADYLGMEYPRYKRLELGKFIGPLEAWELNRMEQFFKLEKGLLQRRHKEFLSKPEVDRRELCQGIWSRDNTTKGRRSQRTNTEYTRMKCSKEQEEE